MCGLAGFIGKSKNPELSYSVITALFSNLEIRGTDASGFWGVNESNQIIYHKEPITSKTLSLRNDWKKLKEFNAELLLTHARGASTGVGLPIYNKNNHPFVSHDKNLAIIHNGRIQDYEYLHLKKYYETNTDCDSEIILRILEDNDDKLVGIEKIWSYLNMAHMAVVIGDINRNLWLFRNKHRELCVIDLIKELGQIFFVSTPSIWHISSFNLNLYPDIQVMPPDELWHISKDLTIDKYDIICEDFLPWDKVGISNLKKNQIKHEIISELGEEDRINRSDIFFSEELMNLINLTKKIEAKHKTRLMLDNESGYDLALNKIKEINNIIKEIQL